ncbi:hypothetical protein OROGR_010183 [Orobanche gracilis]
MAETQQKRPREEETIDFDDSYPNSKRLKPYNNILSLLDVEEGDDEEPNQDLSVILSTLQHEISYPTDFGLDSPPSTSEGDQETSNVASALRSPISDDGVFEDERVKSVMRRLLEASDDELGIPNTEEPYSNVDENRSIDNLPFAFVDNGLWEFEDVAANYYTMLQSELFM